MYGESYTFILFLSHLTASKSAIKIDRILISHNMPPRITS
jgi:hypothetical protein